MGKISKKDIEKGKKLEEEVMGSSARNKHQAEERNQAPLRDNEDDNADEESRYGAVDRKNQQTIGRLDGQAKGLKRFSNYNKTFDRKGLEKMTSTFLHNLPKKSVLDAMLASDSP